MSQYHLTSCAISSDFNGCLFQANSIIEIIISRDRWISTCIRNAINRRKFKYFMRKNSRAQVACSFFYTLFYKCILKREVFAGLLVVDVHIYVGQSFSATMPRCTLQRPHILRTPWNQTTGDGPVNPDRCSASEAWEKTGPERVNRSA